MPEYFIIILIISLLSIFFHSEPNEKQIATFFVCPNTHCRAKNQPKSFIDSKDKHINRLLMTCTSCSQKGYFKLERFFQLKCETCHNTIINDDMFTKFFKNKPTKWYNRSLKHKSKILNPCPHCNTYGAKTYVPELPETERGIQYSSKKKDKTIFILIIIAMIVLFLTLVN